MNTLVRTYHTPANGQERRMAREAERADRKWIGMAERQAETGSGFGWARPSQPAAIEQALSEASILAALPAALEKLRLDYAALVGWLNLRSTFGCDSTAVVNGVDAFGGRLGLRTVADQIVWDLPVTFPTYAERLRANGIVQRTLRALWGVEGSR